MTCSITILRGMEAAAVVNATVEPPTCEFCHRPISEEHRTYFSRRGKRKIVCVDLLGETTVIFEKVLEGNVP